MFAPKVTLEEHEQAIEGLREELTAVRETRNWLDVVLRKRIIVHLKNDQSFDGSLVDVMDDGIILKAARMLNSGAAPTDMRGDLWLPRENVAFAQLDE